MSRTFLTLTAIIVAAVPALGESPPVSETRVLVYGASGRIGSVIVEEALLRGYRVTGVSREAARLEQFAGRIAVEVGDILDRERTAELVSQHDVVIVSVGGRPRDKVPANYIAALAAESLVDVWRNLGDGAPRVVFVGNLFTLEFEDGKTLLELGRVPESHENYAMFYGHQLALDTFRASEGMDWTIATPPNGLRLQGRSGKVRWGGDELLRDTDGKPAQISREDFAFAIFEEVENNNYIRQRFNVAR